MSYPEPPCPFCNIASAFPGPSSSAPSSAASGCPVNPSAASSHPHDASSTAASCPVSCASAPTVTAPAPSSSDVARLLAAVPRDPDPYKLAPACFPVLAADDTLAFLDIMPMTRGHLLVITRRHVEKIGGAEGEEIARLGFWLPLLSRAVTRVTNSTDYNVVQNNGASAAQIVPHIHFHIIPRQPLGASGPANRGGSWRSWTMFGRGQRDDLDEEEAEALAEELREALREEIEKLAGRAKF